MRDIYTEVAKKYGLERAIVKQIALSTMYSHTNEDLESNLYKVIETMLRLNNQQVNTIAK